MLEYPNTIEEARKYRYGQWAGVPAGFKYREGDCAYEVFGSERGATGHQCQHKNGYGADNLYCKRHAQQLGMIEAPKQKPRRMSHGDYLVYRIGKLESALSTIVDWFESRCEVPTGKPFSEEEAELHDLAKEALGRKE